MRLINHTLTQERHMRLITRVYGIEVAKTSLIEFLYYAIKIMLAELTQYDKQFLLWLMTEKNAEIIRYVMNWHTH